MALKHPPTPGFLVWRLSMRWQAAVDRTVAPLGLTHGQYSLLASLRGMTITGHHPSQRELADHTGLDPIFVSKLVRTLERNGLVERSPHPGDSRAVQLALTDTGVEQIDRAVEAVLALQDDLLAPLGGRQSPETKRFTSTIQRLLDAAAPPNPPRSQP
jgi:DNA-binding MarR family transcriptional regulator